jgi:hypothetical protein
MEKYLILTGLFQLTALKISGEYGTYGLRFLGIPWIRSSLEHEVSYLLSLDYVNRCYLDPEAPCSYAEWRDSLEKVGIGIQVWIVNREPIQKLRIWNTENHFPHPSEKPAFYSDSLEWGWRMNSSQTIEMRGCNCSTDEKLGYKPRHFLAAEVKPAISYTWPSEDRHDPKGMNELEAMLLSLLETSD